MRNTQPRVASGFPHQSKITPETRNAKRKVSLRLANDKGWRRDGVSPNSPPSIVIVCPTKKNNQRARRVRKVLGHLNHGR